MGYRVMSESDIDLVIPLYLTYYNEHEAGAWTTQTAYKRIHQIWSREDSYCLLMEEGNRVLGFAIGSMEQYDDLVAYHLAELVISADCQNRGLGTTLMEELERRVKNLGAAMIQLQSVNDEKHHAFYRKLEYYDACNLVVKAKFIK